MLENSRSHSSRKELAMSTMTIPKKAAATTEDMLPPKAVTKEQMHRYRMQVDRLTKASFRTKEEAVKAGNTIKNAFPKVHVSVFDAEKNDTTIL